MNLAPTSLQAEIAETADKFLSDRLPLSQVRALAAAEGPAIDGETWAACAEMGWLGLLAPEADGGLGLGLAEAVLVFRELGRHLTPGPLRSTLLAALVASEAGSGDLAQALAAGERRAGFLMGGLAIDAHVGDLLLSLDAAGGILTEVTSLIPVPSIDPGTRLGRVQASEPVASVADSLLLAKAQLIGAAELLGITEAVRDMSASYSQLRVQFGKPIGSFQAVKHRCADMAIAAYSMRAQVFMAAVLMDSDRDDAAFHAAAAHVVAIGGAQRSTADNIQNHGGIGVTAEHDAHLFLKRGLLLEYFPNPKRGSFSSVLLPSRHVFN